MFQETLSLKLEVDASKSTSPATIDATSTSFESSASSSSASSSTISPIIRSPAPTATMTAMSTATTTTVASSSTCPSTSSLELDDSESPIALPYCPLAEASLPIALPYRSIFTETKAEVDGQQDDCPPTKKRKVLVDEMLTSLKSMEPTAQLELWRRMLATHPFDLRQLQTLKTAIDDRIKVDIVSGVPYEVAAYIMSFLSPKDLCQAGQTCRTWRVICEDNRLWREKCSEEGLLDDEHILSVLMERRISQRNKIQEKLASEYTTSTVLKSQWKSAYLQHINILRNWQRREFEIKDSFLTDRRALSQQAAPPLLRFQALAPDYHRLLPQRLVAPVRPPQLAQPVAQSQQQPARPVHVPRIPLRLHQQQQQPAQQHQHQQHDARADAATQQNQRQRPEPRALRPRPTPGRSQAQLLRKLPQSTQTVKVKIEQQAGGLNTGLGDLNLPSPTEEAETVDNLTEKRQNLLQLRCHEESVITCLQYNPLTNIFVSGSDDQTLKVWSSETGRCLTTLEGHTGGVWASQLSSDDTVISGSTDRTLKIWQAQTGELIHTLYGHASTVRCLALHGDKVVSGSRDTTLRLWDIKLGSCLNVFLGHSAAVRCVEYKGDRIVSGAYDHLVMVWDAISGMCLHALECHENRIYSLQYDGTTIASGSLDTTICVWDAETGKLRHRLEGHTSLTSKMQLKDNILVSANADSLCKIWDIETGKCLRTLAGSNQHKSAITSVYFDKRHVVTSSDDGTVKLWNINTGQFIRNLIVLPTANDGGVVWRIRASYTKLICAIGSRTQTCDTHLLVLNFDD